MFNDVYIQVLFLHIIGVITNYFNLLTVNNYKNVDFKVHTLRNQNVFRVLDIEVSFLLKYKKYIDIFIF